MSAPTRNNEVKTILLGGEYGVRIMTVERDELGNIRLVEPDPKVWVNSCYGDNNNNPPVFNDDNIDYDEKGNIVCAGCGLQIANIDWIPID